MRIRETVSTYGNRGRCGALGGKIEDGLSLLARDAVVLDDLFQSGPIFEVFEDYRDGHPGIAQHPRTAQATGDALHGGALRPV
jgi:hypothetical protein